jgi:hypothetical protein
VAQWLRCIRKVLDDDHGVDGWRILRGDQLYLLSRLRPGPEDDASALFGDDLPSRRRMYVAISRAQRRIHFLIPENDPTPLLRP